MPFTHTHIERERIKHLRSCD